MPRPRKGARLWLRPGRPASGRVAAWIVIDNGRHIATGCLGGASKSPPRAAEEFLARYIAQKYKPARKQRDIDVIDLADVLSIYLPDRAGDQADRAELQRRSGALIQ